MKFEWLVVQINFHYNCFFKLAFPFYCVCLHWSIWPVRRTIRKNNRANWYVTILSILIKVIDRVQNRTFIISNDNAKCRFPNRLSHELTQVAFITILSRKPAPPCIFRCFYFKNYTIHYIITCCYTIYSNFTGLYVLAIFPKYKLLFNEIFSC